MCVDEKVMMMMMMKRWQGSESRQAKKLPSQSNQAIRGKSHLHQKHFVR
jgi:hypothetical protein